MLRLVKENVVYVTVHRFLKHVTELEQQHGYNYKIDKKSVMKCLYALQKAGLVRLYERIVVEDYISSPVSSSDHIHLLEKFRFCD
ncbi:unnamed protein product [Anisakis simplex]|nr:unnamed protein product [Anisakis simplex]